MKGTVFFWLGNARAGAVIQSLLPAFAAAAVCCGEPDFSLPLAAVALLGVAAAHLACNLLDDYFDYCLIRQDYREKRNGKETRIRTGKCSYLISGGVKLHHLRMACAGFAAAAAACGGVIYLARSWRILPVVAAAAFLGYFYSGAPLRIGYHYLGEITIGIVFGPLLACGMALAACGHIPDAVLLFGTASGFETMNISYVHAVLDRKADDCAQKKTLAMVFSNARNSARLAGIFSTVPYILILGAAAAGKLSAWYLLTLASLPLSAALRRSMLCFAETPDKPAARVCWYGPMGQWERICAEGLDWFMLRWYLARNLCGAFSLLAMAAALADAAVKLLP